MADVHKLSERVIDLAERSSAVADAAQGKGVRRRGVPTRWILLPAAGAGLYALMVPPGASKLGLKLQHCRSGEQKRLSECVDFNIVFNLNRDSEAPGRFDDV